MKAKSLIVGLIIFLTSCDLSIRKSENHDFDLINTIIIETIKQDSLDRLIPIKNKLLKYYIYNPIINIETTTGTLPPPPPPPPPSNEKGTPLTWVYFKTNLAKQYGYFITNEDSISIKKQIDNPKLIELDSSRFNGIIKIMGPTYSIKRSEEFYDFLIPLFNFDKTWAFIEYNRRCPACGYGKRVIFKKVENNWIVIDSYVTWIN